MTQPCPHCGDPFDTDTDVDHVEECLLKRVASLESVYKAACSFISADSELEDTVMVRTELAFALEDHKERYP